MFVSIGKLKLYWFNKSINLDKFLYQIYHNIVLNPQDRVNSTKYSTCFENNIFDYRKSNLGVLGRDKIAHTKSRDVDIVTIGNREYVKVWMKKYNRTFYCDNIYNVYDLLIDTRLCYLVSNHNKIQASINSGEYIPHMGQVAIASYQNLLADHNLEQAREIISQLTDYQRLDVDHLIEDRSNCSRFNLSLMDGINKVKYNFLGRFYDPWRIYGAYDPDKHHYLIELDLIEDFSRNVSTVVQSWFFKCKNAESLINLLENLQARNNTILSRSKLDEIYINYRNEVWAFPTPWKQYQQIRARCGQKMPIVKRDTVDDILHQQQLIEMDSSKFVDWTILQLDSNVIDYAHHLLAMTHKPATHLRIEQIR